MSWKIIQGDCRNVMESLEDQSINAIITDPPYYKVKQEAWDNQWKSTEDFLDWMEDLARNHWERLLKPNGSIMVFAAPALAAHIEVMLSRHFRVLNHLVWAKNYPQAKNVTSRRANKSTLRSFFPDSERIIFAEKKGMDPSINGNGAGAFTSLQEYLEGGRTRAGITKAQISRAWRERYGSGGGMVNHWFGKSQWTMPTEEHYGWLQEVLNPHLPRPYADLKEEYHRLRRPFQVGSSCYSDVWFFNTVNGAKSKHPCEKPVDLMRHIVECSTQVGDCILDCFSGSGATGEACLLSGRSFLGIEKDPAYAEASKTRLTSLEGLYALMGRG